MQVSCNHVSVFHVLNRTVRIQSFTSLFPSFSPVSTFFSLLGFAHIDVQPKKKDIPEVSEVILREIRSIERPGAV